MQEEAPLDTEKMTESGVSYRYRGKAMHLTRSNIPMGMQERIERVQLKLPIVTRGQMSIVVTSPSGD
jgi:hypothetical protein